MEIMVAMVLLSLIVAMVMNSLVNAQKMGQGDTNDPAYELGRSVMEQMHESVRMDSWIWGGGNPPGVTLPLNSAATVAPGPVVLDGTTYTPQYTTTQIPNTNYRRVTLRVDWT